MTRSLGEEMACIELVELVTEFLEGALSPQDRERFEKHIALCKGCAAYLLQIRKTIEASRAPRGEELSDTAKERLVRAFRELCK
jgi:anti-sigma factor RsiW